MREDICSAAITARTAPGTALPGGVYRIGANVSHLDEHLLWMRRAGRADRTITMRAAAMVHLAEHLRHDPITATEAELERWQDITPAHAIRQKTSQVRPYFGWCHAKGYRSDNPTALLVVPPARRGVPRPIATADLMRAVDLAPPRVLPWLLLAAWSGLRAMEIAGLRYDDFEHVGGVVFVRVRHTKNGGARTAPLPSWAWSVLAPLLASSGPCWRRERGYGSVTAQHVSQLSNEYLHGIGITDTLHSLRHWTGTEALEITDNLRLVQELLGHLDPASTQVYTQVRPRRLTEVSEALPRPEQSRGLRAVRAGVAH